MSTHFKKVCEFGRIHTQCRCPDPSKTVITVVCDRPQVHGPAYEGKHREPEETAK